MISTSRLTGALLNALLLCGTAQAAEPDFAAAIVLDSRTYERQSSAFQIAGVQAAGTTVSMSRVTVVIDRMLITSEWEPKTQKSATAKDFPRGRDILAAVERARLLLKLPDGSVVTTKIVKRERQKPPELQRRAQD